MLLSSQTFDAEFDHIASFQETLWLHAEADSGRGAGGDNISGMQGHELAEIGNDMGNAIDHGLAGAVLHRLAIDLQPHAEVLRIGYFVLGYEPWADWTEGVAGLALGPLPLTLGLKGALRHIMGNTIAGDVVELGIEGLGTQKQTFVADR